MEREEHCESREGEETGERERERERERDESCACM